MCILSALSLSWKMFQSRTYALRLQALHFLRYHSCYGFGIRTKTSISDFRIFCICIHVCYRCKVKVKSKFPDFFSDCLSYFAGFFTVPTLTNLGHGRKLSCLHIFWVCNSCYGAAFLINRNKQWNIITFLNVSNHTFYLLTVFKIIRKKDNTTRFILF